MICPQITQIDTDNFYVVRAICRNVANRFIICHPGIVKYILNKILVLARFIMHPVKKTPFICAHLCNLDNTSGREVIIPTSA